MAASEAAEAWGDRRSQGGSHGDGAYLVGVSLGGDTRYTRSDDPISTAAAAPAGGPAHASAHDSAPGAAAGAGDGAAAACELGALGPTPGVPDSQGTLGGAAGASPERGAGTEDGGAGTGAAGGDAWVDFGSSGGSGMLMDPHSMWSAIAHSGSGSGGDVEATEYM